jgi:serine/threonine protein kinase
MKPATHCNFQSGNPPHISNIMHPTTHPAEDTAYRINSHPLEETDAPRILNCLAEQEVLILPHTEVGEITPPPRKQVVSIVSPDHPCAYFIIPSKPSKNLNHHAPGWGHVFFGIVLPLVDDGIYQEPSPDMVTFVAIKRLNKQVVHTSLQQGKKENPYVELLRMQTIGDNVHVLGCMEAFQDDIYLYIIMPYCEEESLVECIPWNSGGGVEEGQARIYFEQILENLEYLKSHGICHRDLSPDNCMIYNGRVLFTDLAMSFVVPATTTSNGDDDTVQASSTFGKPAYLPPEVFLQYPFSAFGCDLWSSAVILFNMLTGEVLYEIPHFNNILFRYFILARGISSTTLNERMMEILMDLEDGEQTSLWRKAQVVMALRPDYLELLDGMLRVAPQQRWTFKQVQDHLASHL